MEKPLVILCLDQGFARNVEAALPKDRYNVLIANTYNPRSKFKSGYLSADADLAITFLEENKGKDGFIVTDEGYVNMHTRGTQLTSIANFGQHGTWHTILTSGGDKSRFSHLADKYLSWGWDTKEQPTFVTDSRGGATGIKRR